MLNRLFMLSSLILLVNYNLTEEMMHEWIAVVFVLAGSVHLLNKYQGGKNEANEKLSFSYRINRSSDDSRNGRGCC